MNRYCIAYVTRQTRHINFKHFERVAIEKCCKPMSFAKLILTRSYHWSNSPEDTWELQTPLVSNVQTSNKAPAAPPDIL